MTETTRVPIMDCSTCKFRATDGNASVCRRNPPSVVMTLKPNIASGGMQQVATSMFPSVPSGWWCGEHDAKEGLCS